LLGTPDAERGCNSEDHWNPAGTLG
jgi:hypothetical protein